MTIQQFQTKIAVLVLGFGPTDVVLNVVYTKLAYKYLIKMPGGPKNGPF